MLVTQMCPPLCHPLDCSPPGSSAHGISQARILEWVAISYSRGSFPTQGSNLSLLCLLHWQADSLAQHQLGSLCRGLKVKSESEVAQSSPTLCDLWTIVHQAPPSMEFSRQECWSGLPLPFPGDIPDPGIEPASPTLAGGFFTAEQPGKPDYKPGFLYHVRF